jgi:GDP-D-mannose dehydratase
MRTALITGISGQDGSYLAEYLLGLGYRVFGLVRHEPGATSWLAPIADQIELLHGDLRDAASLEGGLAGGVARGDLYPGRPDLRAGELGADRRDVRRQRRRPRTAPQDRGAAEAGRARLSGVPNVEFPDLVHMMIRADLEALSR